MTHRIATVFGGTGFLGQAVVQTLAAEGYDVRLPIRKNAGNIASLRLLSSKGKVLPILTSFRSDSSLFSVCKSADIVVNLIGIFREKGDQTFQTTHVELAARIARLARGANVKTLVHISTLGASLDSQTPYLRSKALGEEATLAFFPEAIILRPAPMLGHAFEERLSFWSRFCPLLPLVKNGVTEIWPVPVKDVAKAILSYARRKEARGHIHTLIGTCGYSLETLVRIPAEKIGIAPSFLRFSPWIAKNAARFPIPFPGRALIRDQIHILQVHASEEQSGGKL